jgi:hypothetical protein
LKTELNCEFDKANVVLPDMSGISTAAGKMPAWRWLAILWTVVSVSLLIHTLLHRFASPHAFGDAEEVEELLMMILSFPGGLVAFLPFSGIALNYPENDPRSIVLGWFVFFIIGYVQWFVLTPALVRRVRHKRLPPA